MPTHPWMLPLAKQLVPLIHLEPNWDGYGAPPPTKELAKKALCWLREHLPPEIPVPTACALSTGGLQFQWEDTSWYIELEYHSDTDVRLYTELHGDHREYEDISGDPYPLHAALRQAYPL